MRTRTTQGSIALISLVYLAVFAVLATALVQHSLSYRAWQKNELVRTQAFYIAEGALAYAVHALNEDPNYAGESHTALGAGGFSITITPVDSVTKDVEVVAYVGDEETPLGQRVLEAQVGITSAVVSFNYAMQAGAGGFVLNNSSQIIGNVFSAGPVIGNNGNDIDGDVVSAGASGEVYGVSVSGSVHAHTIGNSGDATTIGGDAYFTSIQNTTVSGESYPNSPDQVTAALPISDAQIASWKDEASAGGTTGACVGGTYTVSSDMTLGPVKVPCNLHIQGSQTTLTLAGHVWVEGDITTQSGPTIAIAPALGNKNVAIIASNPSNPSGSGTISIGQGTSFEGSGHPQSFALLVSENTSASLGGGTTAISLSQGASALIAYAARGLVSLGQSVSVREVTAYQVALSQSATVTYDSGLPHTLFHSGPGGSFQIIPGTYRITQ